MTIVDKTVCGHANWRCSNAVLCSDDEFFIRRFLCIFHDSGCRTNIINKFYDFLTALDEPSIKPDVLSFFFYIFGADDNMSWTSTFVEGKLFYGSFSATKRRVRIRDKQNLVIISLLQICTAEEDVTRHHTLSLVPEVVLI